MSLLTLLLAANLPLLLPTSSTDDADASVAPVFLATLADGTTRTVRISRLDERGWTLRDIAEGREWAISAGNLVSLRRDGITAPTLPERSSLLFPDGDRLRADITRQDDDALIVQSPCLGPLDVPILGLIGLVLNVPSDPETTQAIFEAIRSEPGGKEVVFLANDDRIEAAYLGMSGDSIEIERRGNIAKLPRAGIRGIAFDAKLSEYPKPRGTYLEFSLTDGSRVSAPSGTIESGAIVTTSRWGSPMRIPLAEVAKIVTRSDAIVYLSEKGDDGLRITPYLGSPRPVRRDLAVDGLPLLLGGQTYDRGLGMQSRTLMAFRLDPSARRFQSRIGLDDRAGPLGSVVFRVRLDRTVLFESSPMAQGFPPRDLDLPIEGGSVLILEVDYGERGDVRDFADWIEARIIRNGGVDRP